MQHLSRKRPNVSVIPFQIILSFSSKKSCHSERNTSVIPRFARNDRGMGGMTVEWLELESNANF